ncbi:MAG TPA: formyltransferase family protein [Gaiellaceae bacterium]|nr:formyltransferase family protein [Gaiellaceae bacterium]
MRVAVITRMAEVAVALDARVRELGHETVGVLTTPGPPGRYEDDQPSTGALVDAVAPHLDVLVAAGAHRFAALLAALEPDAALCGGFPLRIPPEALRVPPLGIVNGHPSRLPRYRGPNPIAWALRNGDEELGFTYHRMDEDFDTGAILARGSAPLADVEGPQPLLERILGLALELLPEALERLERGDPGLPQPEEGASHAGFFEPEYAEIDWTRPALDVHRQVRAWWSAAVREGPHGPLTELARERVLVLRTRLDGAEGGTRVECGDGPIWVVETVPAAQAAASPR